MAASVQDGTAVASAVASGVGVDSSTRRLVGTVGTRVQGTKNLSFNKVSRGATLPKTCASSESNENSYEFMRIARTPFNSRF